MFMHTIPGVGILGGDMYLARFRDRNKYGGRDPIILLWAR
jgi:hypothetical protein